MIELKIILYLYHIQNQNQILIERKVRAIEFSALMNERMLKNDCFFTNRNFSFKKFLFINQIFPPLIDLVDNTSIKNSP